MSLDLDCHVAFLHNYGLRMGVCVFIAGLL